MLQYLRKEFDRLIFKKNGKDKYMKYLKGKTGKINIISAFCLLIALLAGYILFEQIVPVYVDDAMYSSWAKHGVKYFIQKNIWHYNNFNGRFFVHALLSLVTFFGEHLYALLMPVFIAGSAFLTVSSARENYPLCKKLFVAALSLLLFLSISSTYLTSVLWMAGGFNYVFPFFVLTLFYRVFLKFRKKRLSFLYLCPFAFLCGATTEQFGMYTCGLIVMTYLYDFIDSRKFDFKFFAYIVSTVAGLCTVLLSPGTSSRITQATQTGQSRSLYDGYFSLMKYLTGEKIFYLPVLLMFLCSISALPSLKDKNYRYGRGILVGIPLSALALALGIRGDFKSLTTLFTLFIIFMIVNLFLKKENRHLCTTLLCGFGTLFMMSISPAIGYRVCIPFLFSFIIVTSVGLIDLASSCEKALKFISCLTLCAVVIGSGVSYTHAFRGYFGKNPYCQSVYDELSQAEESGYIEFDFDETLNDGKAKYRYTTLFDRADLIRYYREPFAIPENVKVNITSEKYDVSNVCYKDTYIFVPAVNYKGKVYIAYNAFAYLPDFENNIYTYSSGGALSVNGKQVCRKSDMLWIYRWADASEFIEISAFCKLYEVRYTFDSEKNTYFFN